MAKTQSAIIVGGSISGLLAAIALARVGVQVSLLERAPVVERRGAVLAVDPPMRGEDENTTYLRQASAKGDHGPLAWRYIHQNLRQAITHEPLVQSYFEHQVTLVGQTEDYAYATTKSGMEFHGDIVIGADGVRSLVRQVVNPDQPRAEFAGYLLWVAIVEEQEIPEKVWPYLGYPRFSSQDGEGEDFLFSTFVPGMDGRHAVGNRQLGLAWYDNSFNDLLYSSGAVKDGLVRHSLSGASIPTHVLERLRLRAGKYFDAPFRAAAEVAVDKRYFVATPIAEYVPPALVNGRLALVGDAAHIMTPMTAKGYNSSVLDAAQLVRGVQQFGLHGEGAYQVLAAYEADRLAEVQQIVRGGKSFSRSYGR